MQIEQLGIDPIRARFPMDRLYVFSGRGSVRALPNTVMGIGSFFLPPVSGRDFSLRYQLNLPEYETAIGDAGRPEHYAPPQVMLQSIRWNPWSIERQGTYHRRVDGRLISLDIQSELLSPADADGVLERITLTLRSPATLRIDIRPMLDQPAHAFGVCPPAAWNYEPPAARHQVWSEGPLNWRVDDCRVKLIGEGRGLKAGPRGWSLEMKQGQRITLHLGLAVEGPGMTPMQNPLSSHADSARAYWDEQFAWVNRKFGRQIDRMGDREKLLFYRGWVTAMTSRWDRENFIARPFYAAEGIDGGSVCSYLWDLSYVSHFLVQLEGKRLRGLIETMIDPEKIFVGYSLSPLAHEWLGVFYAFNPYALIHIVANYVDATGDNAFITRKVQGRRVIDALQQILDTFDKRYASSKGVLDFGHNRHLIELHTAGYEGLVPNPNYEHVYCWRTMDRLRQLAGLERRADDLKRAETLLTASNRLFWNAQQGWHFPAAQRDEAGIWSIQTLSALRLGVYSQEQAKAIAENLREGRFLGPCGVYSIARDDQPHFTLNDVDWGGGGCFTGHVAIILEGLSHYGLDDAMERILSRIAWWGDALPYIPQQTRADAPVSDGRPNAVAGAAICQALLAMQKD